MRCSCSPLATASDERVFIRTASKRPVPDERVLQPRLIPPGAHDMVDFGFV